MKKSFFLSCFLSLTMTLLGQTTIQYGDNISASIQTNGEVDTYQFTAAAGDVVMFRVGSFYTNFDVKIEVINASNTVIASQLGSNGTARLTNLAIPQTGNYRVTVRDNQGDFTGSYGCSLQKVNTPSINPTAYNTNAALSNLSYGSIQALSFNGQLGDKITFRIGTFYSSTNFSVEIYSPNGALVRSQQAGSGHLRVDSLNLIQSGLYTILIMETSGNQTVSSIGFALYKVNSPNISPTAYNTNAALPNLSYGSIQALSFNGQLGDKITFRIGTFYSSTNFSVEIYSPNGALVRSQQAGSGHLRVDSLNLIQSGLYTILIMETSGNQTVSSIGFALHKVNSPSYNLINYHINADLPNLSYGSMQALSFNGIQNDKIVFRVATFYSSINFVVEVYAPNGNLIRQQQTSNNVIRVDNLTLPQNGIYTILVMEKTGNQSVSSIGYSLQKVNSPNITLTPINSNTLMPDLNTYAAIHPLAFNATANDRITFRLGGETAPPQYQVEIYTPTGILLDMKQTSTGYIRFDSLILPATGIYTILVMDDDGKDQSFFGYGVSLQKVNQAAISLTPINANVPMPALDYGFINPIAVNVEAGDRIMLRLGAGTTTPQYQIEIYDPLGRQVAIKNTTTGYIRFDSMTLTTSGVYTFLIMEKLGLIQTGSNFGVSIQKTNSPTISRTAINANIAMPNLSYGFTQPIAVNVQSGDKIALRLGSFSATPQYQVEVYDPAGRQVAISETKTGYLRFNNMTLSETGIYTFLIMDKFGRQTVSTGYGISIQKVNTPNITLTTYNTNDAPSLLDYGAINPLTFNALVGERATFRVSSSSNSFNFQIELYDASGNFIVTRTGTNGSLRIDSFTIAQSGRYTLLYMESNGRQTVTSFGTSLQRRTNLPNNPTVLISQQTVSATFSQYSQITPYVFTAKAGDNFGVTMSSNFSSVRPRMELFGPDGTLLRFGTASSSLGFNSIRLSQTGQFVLWAMDDNGRNSGDYLLNYQLIVGTKEINEVKSVQVMPNPATTICQIEYEAKGGEKADFMIFTEGGVLASAVRGIVCKANKNLLSCDVSNLAAGVYVCRLQVDGATSVRRLVVVH